MVCPTCGSNEVVAIQGESFCITCGQLVPRSAAPVIDTAGLPAGVKLLGVTAQPPASPTKRKYVRLPKLGKRKPGRPKAGALDVPAEATARVIAAHGPALHDIRPPVAGELAPQVLTLRQHHVSQFEASVTKDALAGDDAPTKDRTEAQDQSSEVEPGTAAAQGLDAPSARLQPMPPLADAPKTSEQTSPGHAKSEQPTPLAVAEAEPSAPPVRNQAPRPVADAPVRYGHALSVSLSGRLTHQRGVIMAVPATVLAFVAGGIGLAALGHHGDALATTSLGAGWVLAGEAVIIAILYYLVRSLAHAAVIFGTARLADHRPLSPRLWLPVAATSQGRRLITDLTAAAGLVIVAALAAGLVVSGGHALTLPAPARIAILLLAFGVLLYVATAIVMAVSLAHVAVTLAPVRAWAGLRLGWRLFRHHFELTGARLVALAFEAVLLVALAGATAGWLMAVPAPTRPVVVLIAALALAVIGALAGAGTAIWWTRTYQMLVQADHPAGFHRLLALQMPSPGHPWAGRLVAITVAGLSVAAATWPWLAPAILGS